MNKVILFLYILFSLPLMLIASEKRGSIEIEIRDLKSERGVVRIALYSSEDGFPDEPEKATLLESVEISKRPLSVSFKDITYGYHAIAIFHDENANGEFDMTWYFKPLEGYGISNMSEPKIGPPKFKKAKFELNSAQMKLPVKILYH